MNAPIVIEKLLNAPVEKVWQAITDKNEMKQWYFDLDEFRPEKGFRFSFAGQGHKGEQYIHLCEIKEIIPMKKLVYSWTYQGFEGYSEVSFELTDKNGQTQLKLTHSGLESFPAHSPDFARESFLQGWTELIGKSLPGFVEQ